MVFIANNLQWRRIDKKPYIKFWSFQKGKFSLQIGGWFSYENNFPISVEAFVPDKFSKEKSIFVFHFSYDVKTFLKRKKQWNILEVEASWLKMSLSWLMYDFLLREQEETIQISAIFRENSSFQKLKNLWTKCIYFNFIAVDKLFLHNYKYYYYDKID